MSQMKLKVWHSVRSPHVETEPDSTQEQLVLFFSELSSKTRSSGITCHTKLETLNQQFTTEFVSRNTQPCFQRYRKTKQNIKLLYSAISEPQV